MCKGFSPPPQTRSAGHFPPMCNPAANPRRSRHAYQPWQHGPPTALAQGAPGTPRALEPAPPSGPGPPRAWGPPGALGSWPPLRVVRQVRCAHSRISCLTLLRGSSATAFANPSRAPIAKFCFCLHHRRALRKRQKGGCFAASRCSMERREFMYINSSRGGRGPWLRLGAQITKLEARKSLASTFDCA